MFALGHALRSSHTAMSFNASNGPNPRISVKLMPTKQYTAVLTSKVGVLTGLAFTSLRLA